MKKSAKKISVLFLILLLVLSALVSCAAGGVWENATYTEDTTLGTGAVEVTVKVTAENKTVTFTLRTDEADLASALLAEDLVAGTEGPYGLYIVYVNGIRADFTEDNGYWWNLSVNGEPSMVGASDLTLTSGTVYEFVRQK